ncbi:MAG: kinase-like domain-containing protein [Monoraphidium minutum]|nr:MAG: kinase-like domain-containing protein [Monoraphidium minutum]
MGSCLAAPRAPHDCKEALTEQSDGSHAGGSGAADPGAGPAAAAAAGAGSTAAGLCGGPLAPVGGLSGGGGGRRGPQEMSDSPDLGELDSADAFEKVTDTLQRLGGASGAPTLALRDAARIIAESLGVELCCITAVHNSAAADGRDGSGGGAGGGTTVLLAAHGAGAALLQDRAVMRGPRPSALQAAGQAQAPQPLVLSELCSSAGLRSVLSVPIALPEAPALGALTVASAAPRALEGAAWARVLPPLASALLPHLRSKETACLCELLAALDAAGDPAAFVDVLLAGSARFVQLATNAPAATRFGAVDPGRTRVVLIDRRARSLPDLARYLESLDRPPAADIFMPASSQRPLAALVVAPLCRTDGGDGGGDGGGGEPPVMGGLYFTLAAPFDVRQLQEPIYALVTAVLPLAQRQLAGRFDQLQALVASSARAAQQGPGRGEGSDRGPDGALGVAGSGPQYIPDLVLLRVIGRRAVGICYQGYFRGTPAVVKAMYEMRATRDAQQDASELAALAAVRHPNVAWVYACFTDMAEVLQEPDYTPHGVGVAGGGGGDGGGGDGSARVRYRPLLAGEEALLQPCNLIVMEWCDRGSLRDAVRAGAFHQQVAPTEVLGVDLPAILQVLIDVARGLAHIHSLGLVHCDLDNVLLKSDPSSPLGAVAKVSDFGLCRALGRDYCSAVGNVAHLAPELALAGPQSAALDAHLGPAVDAYGLGMMMYELYSAHRAFAGLAPDEVYSAAAVGGARPEFPRGAPAELARLAAACWAHDPAARPPLPEVVQGLELLAAAVGVVVSARRSQQGSSSGGGAARGG